MLTPSAAPTDLTTLNEILAPACKALFGGTPDLLATAIELNPRLRGSYQRAAAQGMYRARRTGDAAKVQEAAETALRIARGELAIPFATVSA